MAYNVLKGAVEGSVDQYGDQEIDGIKIFKNTISASVFYDTDAQSPCATIKDVALTGIKSGAHGSLLIYEGDKTASTHHSLKFDSKRQVLSAKILTAQSFYGSAEGLKNVPANEIKGTVAAGQVNYGLGLQNVRSNLQIKASSGIKLDEEGISVSLNTNSGLSINANNLIVDPERTEAINRDGQNLSDQDLLLVADISRGVVQHTTLSNLYDKYIKAKSLLPAGNVDEIQIKGQSGLVSSSNLKYDSSKSILMVDGQLQAKSMQINGATIAAGQVVKNIKKIDSEIYQVQEDDYTILCDSLKSSINVILPPACNCRGRILVIKKTNTNKYKINSNVVNIKVEEGTIDLKDTAVVKMNYSSRTLQSDGENWCVIGSAGT